MTAAITVAAGWFMVVAVIGLTVSAVYHMVVGRRHNRRVTQLRRRQLDTLCARDQIRRQQ